MNSKLLVIFAALTIAAVNAQKAARIGPDGKPLLNRPDVAECEKSKRFITLIWYGWCLATWPDSRMKKRVRGGL